MCRNEPFFTFFARKVPNTYMRTIPSRVRTLPAYRTAGRELSTRRRTDRMKIEPFTIAVPEATLDDLRLRLAATR